MQLRRTGIFTAEICDVQSYTFFIRVLILKSSFVRCVTVFFMYVNITPKPSLMSMTSVKVNWL